MELNSFLQRCSDDDVLEIGNQMAKLSKFKSDSNFAFSWDSNTNALSAILNYIKAINFNNINVRQLINGDGVEANILRIGSQGWKKGKIKFKIILEFCPDEPDFEDLAESNNTEISQTNSPLDDIRQMMNK